MSLGQSKRKRKQSIRTWIAERDKKVLLFINHIIQKNPLLYKAFDIISVYSSTIFFILYSSGGLWILFAAKAPIIVSMKASLESGLYEGYFFAPFVAIALSFGLRALFKRKRPFGRKQSYSFPSNHATSSAAIAFAFCLIHPLIGTILFFMAFLTGLSRIVTLRHYPLDVCVGWGLGLVIGVLARIPVFFVI